jgi:Cof subfamily protein (haloacid dehalogenase superfamily)
MNYAGMVITDLDGTLLKNNHRFCDKDINTLRKLGLNRISRAIATGRSLFSLRKVIDENFPVDFIIFSSGAGIIDWKTKEIIFKKNITHNEYIHAYELLHNLKLDFMVHWPIPENHKFIYYANDSSNTDFFNRIEIYKDFAIKGENGSQAMDEVCQLLAINNDVAIYDMIKKELPTLKVIRATSPLNHSSLWIEIFHQTVSKGFSMLWLCKHLGIPIQNTLGIGNDYNDFDLLKETNHSYVVANAPDDLKIHFEITDSNDENGFSKAVFNTFDIES